MATPEFMLPGEQQLTGVDRLTQRGYMDAPAPTGVLPSGPSAPTVTGGAPTGGSVGSEFLLQLAPEDRANAEEKGNYLDLIQMGGYQFGEGMAALTNLVFGGTVGLETMERMRANYQEEYDNLAPDLQEDIDKKWATTENAAWSDLGAIFSQTLLQLPTMASMLVPGVGLGAAGARVAGGALATKVAAKVATKNLSDKAKKELAEKIIKRTESRFSVRRKGAGQAAGVGGVVTEGAIGAGFTYNEASQNIDAMDSAELAQASPEYAALISQGMSETEAKQAFKQSAGVKLPAIVTGLATGLFGGVAARGLGRLTQGGWGAGSRIKGGVKQAGLEAITEGPQEAIEQLGSNIATPGKGLAEGLAEAVAAGTGLGGVMGGTTGVIATGRSGAERKEIKAQKAAEKAAKGPGLLKRGVNKVLGRSSVLPTGDEVVNEGVTTGSAAETAALNATTDMDAELDAALNEGATDATTDATTEPAVRVTTALEATTAVMDEVEVLLPQKSPRKPNATTSQEADSWKKRNLWDTLMPEGRQGKAQVRADRTANAKRTFEDIATRMVEAEGEGGVGTQILDLLKGIQPDNKSRAKNLEIFRQVQSLVESSEAAKTVDGINFANPQRATATADATADAPVNESVLPTDADTVLSEDAAAPEAAPLVTPEQQEGIEAMDDGQLNTTMQEVREQIGAEGNTPEQNANLDAYWKAAAREMLNRREAANTADTTTADRAAQEANANTGGTTQPIDITGMTDEELYSDRILKRLSVEQLIAKSNELLAKLKDYNASKQGDPKALTEIKEARRRQWGKITALSIEFGKRIKLSEKRTTTPTSPEPMATPPKAELNKLKAARKAVEEAINKRAKEINKEQKDLAKALTKSQAARDGKAGGIREQQDELLTEREELEKLRDKIKPVQQKVKSNEEKLDQQEADNKAKNRARATQRRGQTATINEALNDIEGERTLEEVGDALEVVPKVSKAFNKVVGILDGAEGAAAVEKLAEALDKQQLESIANSLGFTPTVAPETGAAVSKGSDDGAINRQDRSNRGGGKKNKGKLEVGASRRVIAQEIYNRIAGWATTMESLIQMPVDEGSVMEGGPLAEATLEAATLDTAASTAINKAPERGVKGLINTVRAKLKKVDRELNKKEFDSGKFNTAASELKAATEALEKKSADRTAKDEAKKPINKPAPKVDSTSTAGSALGANTQSRQDQAEEIQRSQREIEERKAEDERTLEEERERKLGEDKVASDRNRSIDAGINETVVAARKNADALTETMVRGAGGLRTTVIRLRKKLDKAVNKNQMQSDEVRYAINNLQEANQKLDDKLTAIKDKAEKAASNKPASNKPASNKPASNKTGNKAQRLKKNSEVSKPEVSKPAPAAETTSDSTSAYELPEGADKKKSRLATGQIDSDPKSFSGPKLVSFVTSILDIGKPSGAKKDWASSTLAETVPSYKEASQWMNAVQMAFTSTIRWSRGGRAETRNTPEYNEFTDLVKETYTPNENNEFDFDAVINAKQWLIDEGMPDAGVEAIGNFLMEVQANAVAGYDLKEKLKAEENVDSDVGILADGSMSNEIDAQTLEDNGVTPVDMLEDDRLNDVDNFETDQQIGSDYRTLRFDLSSPLDLFPTSFRAHDLLTNYIREAREAFRSSKEKQVVLGTASDVLKQIAKVLPKNHPYRLLASTLAKFTDASKVVFINDTKSPLMRGAYSSSDKVIVINLGADVFSGNNNTQIADGIIKTLMHEAVHAATYSRLAGDASYRKRMQQLMTVAMDNTNISDMYGGTDVFEFVAEAMSNPAFQKELAKVSMADGKAVTIWTKFVQLVSRALGMSTLDNKNLLSLVMSTGMDGFKAESSLEKYSFRERFDTGLNPQEGELYAAGYSLRDIVSIRLEEERTSEKWEADYGPDLTVEELQLDGDDLMYDMDSPTSGTDFWNRVKKEGRGYAMEGLRRIRTLDHLIRQKGDLFDAVVKDLGDISPAKAWLKIQNAKTIIASRAMQNVHDLMTEVNTLPNAQQKKLYDLMYLSSLWRIHPGVELGKGINKHVHIRGKHAEQHAIAGKKINKLYKEIAGMKTKKGKSVAKLYKDMAKFTLDSREEITGALLERLMGSFKLAKDENVSAKQRKAFLAARNEKSLDDLSLPEAYNDMVKAAKRIIGKSVIEGPYFPFRRYGDFVVSGYRESTRNFKTVEAAENAAAAWELNARTNSATINGTEVKFEGRVFSMRQTQGEAETLRSKLAKDGYTMDMVTEKILPEQQMKGKLGDLAKLFMKDLDSTDGEMRTHLERALLELLADNPMAANQLERKGYAGIDTSQMGRAFAEYGWASSWQIADAKTATESEAAYTQMKNLTKDDKEYEPKAPSAEILLERAKLLKEIQRRDSNAITARRSSLAEASVGKIGFMWFLASPHYSIMNATQPWLLGLPHLATMTDGKGGLNGVLKSRKALSTAYGKVMKSWYEGLASVDFGVSGSEQEVFEAMMAGLKPKDRAVIQLLADQNVIDSTFIQELMDTVTGKDTDSSNNIFNIARTLPSSIETVNRMVMGLAAAELNGTTAEDKNGIPTPTGGNIDEVIDAVRFTQFDYSLLNRPDLFKGGALKKTLFMFKMYPLGVYQMLGHGMGKALNGKTDLEKLAGAKLVAGIVLSHTMASGVAGGLLMEPVRMLVWGFMQALSAAGLREDDEDVETWMRGVMDGVGISPKTIDVVLYGLPNIVGLNAHGQLGINNLAFGRSKQLSEGAELTSLIGLVAFGPFANIGQGLINAGGHALDGQILKAVGEAAPIGAVRNLAKGIDMKVNGLTDFKGRKIAAPEDISFWSDSIPKALGLNSRAVSATYEARRANTKWEMYWQDKWRKLSTELALADSASDRAKIIAAMRQYNKDAPASQRKRSSSVKQGLKQSKKRQALTKGGYYSDTPEGIAAREKYSTVED